MIALKTLRRDLSARLAAGIGVADAPLGSKVNPPAVVVASSGGDYLTALDYCTDAIVFDVTIIAPAGDPPAVADALDDLIDQVRSTLVKPYQFRGVGGLTAYTSGELTFPAVVATVAVERHTG